MGAEDSTQAIYGVLQEFVHHRLAPTENFQTLVAVFSGPLDVPESEFEKILWQQLADLHEIDREFHDWAPDVDADPDSKEFGFSLIGHPFFVVGLHNRSSRITRRFPWPALAFNSHHQFRRLKENGTFEGLKKKIREREIRLQQSINPNLADFGEESEARQYSGRAVEPAWMCPIFPLGHSPERDEEHGTTVRAGVDK